MADFVKEFEIYRDLRSPHVVLFFGACVTAGLCMVNISEPAMPYAFGLRATTGLDGQYKLADNFAVTANFGLSALATMEYQNRQDAARRASLTGQGTSNALFSSLVQSWLEVGVVFIIR